MLDGWALPRKPVMDLAVGEKASSTPEPELCANIPRSAELARAHGGVDAPPEQPRVVAKQVGRGKEESIQ